MPDTNEGVQATPAPDAAMAMDRRSRFNWRFPALRVSLVIAAGFFAWYSSGHWNRWTGNARYQETNDACVAGDVNRGLIRDLDWPGLIFATIGFGALYAALDQGNRLDWSNNGLVTGLLISGGVITACFVFRELTTAHPFLNLGRLLRGNMLLLLLLLAGFRLIILSTAYIIPTYLQVVQNFRELQVGSVLLWIALPQLILAFPLVTLLRRIDARWIRALGTGLIGLACWVATGLTSQWATDDFLPSQILQAVGQSFALTALLTLIIWSINPMDALAVGCLLQISRLFGGEIGTAFMQTFVRMREQVHSNLVGLHVDGTAGQTVDRLMEYSGAVGTRTADLGEAAVRAAKLLAATVAQQASVLSYIDGFLAAGAGAFVCLILVAMMRRPPQDHPLSQ